jgi:predicted MPP superfamily phosphohydrolase
MRLGLFLAFWIGHGYLLMLILNVTYSQPYHRKFLKLLRLSFGLLLLAGPPLFGWAFGWDLAELLQQGSAGTSLLPACYAGLCLLLGLIAFPLVTIWRLIRPTSRAVLSETSRLIDVQKELGHRPVGHGKHRHLAEASWNQFFHVEFTTLNLAIPNLPAPWEGLQILHLSDAHFYGTPGQEYFEFLINECLKHGTPDLVILSGDILDDDRYLEWIEPIFGKLKWNVAAFAVLGNHDWWNDDQAVRKQLQAIGIKDIGNRWETIEVRSLPLVVAGHEGPWFRPAPDLSEAPEGFRLLVSHSPDNIGWARHNQMNLMLSGHNHGGQIRLPVVGSLFVPSAYSRRYDMGTFQEGSTVLHVNRGLGGKEPIRFRCPPQISWLVLRGQDRAGS